MSVTRGRVMSSNLPPPAPAATRRRLLRRVNCPPSRVLAHETLDVIECLRRFRKERGDLEDVRRFGPQLEFDVHAGGIRPLGRADRLVAQHLGAAGLEKQRRVSREIGEDR